MGYMRITMDNVTYRVRVLYDTYVNEFQLIEGPNAGDMLSGRHERDLIGTEDIYEMAVSPDPAFPEDYDAFFDAVRSPVDSHSITVIDGQSMTTYQAMIQSGRRIYKGILSGRHMWDGLTVRYLPVKPQREADS